MNNQIRVENVNHADYIDLGRKMEEIGQTKFDVTIYYCEGNMSRYRGQDVKDITFNEYNINIREEDDQLHFEALIEFDKGSTIVEGKIEWIYKDRLDEDMTSFRFKLSNGIVVSVYFYEP